MVVPMLKFPLHVALLAKIIILTLQTVILYVFDWIFLTYITIMVNKYEVLRFDVHQTVLKINLSYFVNG